MVVSQMIVDNENHYHILCLLVNKMMAIGGCLLKIYDEMDTYLIGSFCKNTG